jgi:hypothetical protein
MSPSDANLRKDKPNALSNAIPHCNSMNSQLPPKRPKSHNALSRQTAISNAQTIPFLTNELEARS